MPILIVLALVGGCLYFAYSAYGTLSPCTALRVAYEADAEGIVGEMMLRDSETRTIDVAATIGESTEGTRRLADEFARETAQGENILRCTYLIAYRAFDRSGFRAAAAEAILDARNRIPRG